VERHTLPRCDARIGAALRDTLAKWAGPAARGGAPRAPFIAPTAGRGGGGAPATRKKTRNRTSERRRCSRSPVSAFVRPLELDRQRQTSRPREKRARQPPTPASGCPERGGGSERGVLVRADHRLTSAGMAETVASVGRTRGLSTALLRHSMWYARSQQSQISSESSSLQTQYLANCIRSKTGKV